MNNIKELYLQLLKFTINNENTVPPCDNTFALAVFNISKRQDLLHMLFENAVTFGILNENDECYGEWKENYTRYKTRDIRQLVALDEISEILNKNGIRHMPLKGLLIKELYPKTYYRRMTDLDILVDTENMEKTEKLLSSIGYEMLHDDDTHHFSMYKKPGINIEVHKNLFTNELEDLFSDIWNNAKSKENNCYIMSNEDLILHTILHYSVHFKSDGIGIRSIIDIYFLVKNYPEVLSSHTFTKRLKESGFEKFFNQIYAISYHLFEGKELNEEQKLAEKYLLSSGEMGTPKDQAANYAGKLVGFQNKGKFTIYMNLIFPKYSDMCLRFGVLKKCPFFLPIFWIYRILRMPFYTKNKFILVKELSKVDSKEIEKRKKILDAFGVK